MQCLVDIPGRPTPSLRTMEEGWTWRRMVVVVVGVNGGIGGSKNYSRDVIYEGRINNYINNKLINTISDEVTALWENAFLAQYKTLS